MNTVSLVSNGQIAWATLDLIRSAQSEIISIEFLFRSDDFGLSKLAALRQRAREGVKVYIHVDAFHLLIEPAMLYHLAEEGIQFTVFNKLTFWNFPRMSYRNHCKFLIVDGQKMKMGDTNTGNEYVHWPHQFYMKSMDAIVEGPIVENARNYALELIDSPWTIVQKIKLASEEKVKSQREMIKKWIYATKIFFKLLHVQMDAPEQITRPECILVTQEEVNLAKKALDKAKERNCPDVVMPLKIPAVGTQLFLDHLRGKHQFHGVESSVEKFIKSASRSLQIVSPYLILTPLTKKAIQEALKKGVEVILYTNSLKSTDNKTTQLAYEYRVKELCKFEGNISVYEFEGPETLHAKFILKDSVECMIMSYNLDWRSQIKNLESALLIPSLEATRQLKEWLIEHESQFRLIAKGQELFKEPIQPKTTKDLVQKWTIQSIEKHL